ncbi:MAG: succinylglutamate desuccinylase/aspartoacylase family protein [Lachnospirales bacterium]
MKNKFLYEYDSVSVEAYVFGDASVGKTLTITSGVHGCEYVPILVAKKLINLLENMELNGAVKIVPLINKSGFYNGLKQLAKEDGKNLNRCFPGNPNGTHSEKMAYLIERDIYPETDFLLDLHAGDIDEYAFPFVFFPVASGEEIEEKSREAAKSMPISTRVRSTSKNGLYSHASQCGIPALLMEWGGYAKYNQSEVEECVNSVLYLLAHLGILPNEDLKNIKHQYEVENAQYISAVSEGCWYFNVEGEDFFKQGDVLGVLKDFEDNVLQEVIAKFDGRVLYSSTSLGVTEGYPLVAYGEKFK